MADMKSTDFVTSLTSPPDVTQTYYDTNLLMNAEYYLFHTRWASKRSLKHRQGQNIILRRYAYFTQALGPLTEGEPPAGKNLALTDFQAALSQRGDFVAITDFAEFTQRDELLNIASDKLGKQAGYTMDSVDRDVAVAGTGNIVYANGTARTAVNSIIDGNDLDRAIRSLYSNGARMMVKGSGPQSGQGTMPVMPGYPCIISPELYTDLQNISGYRSVETYKTSGTMFDGEMGRYKNLVFFVAPDADNLGAGAKIFASGGASSTVVTNTAGTVDVHTVLIFGEEYFTHVPLTGESVGMIFHKVGSAGTADPLNQVGTAGWKETSTRLRTNENWGARIECAVTL